MIANQALPDAQVKLHISSPTKPGPALLLWTTTALIWFYLFADASGSRLWISIANLIGPLGLGLAAMTTGLRLLTRDPSMLWTPYTWFMAFIVLFCSLGPLLYPLAGKNTVQSVNSFIPVNSHELLRTNLLNAVGIAALLLGFLALGQVSDWLVPKRSRHPVRSTNLKRVAWIFLVVGGVLRFLVILPYTYGLDHFVLPGVILSIGDLFLFGLMVMAFLVVRGDRSLRIPFYILWLIQIATSFLTFSKQSFLLSIVLPVVGAYFGNRKLVRLMAWAFVITLVYFSLESFIGYARQQIEIQSGNTGRATLTQRVRIAQNWFGGKTAQHMEGLGAAKGGWARLDYAPAQAFAMARYDEGYPGNTLRYAAILFIPRFVWPQKPVITNMGAQFYALVTGRHGSQLGLGIFGEGYWDAGWIGVLCLSFVTGMIFAVLGRFTSEWMRNEAFEYLPPVFITVLMGSLGMTTLFVPAVMGGTGFFLAYAGLIWFLKQVFGTQSSLRADYG